MRDLVCIIPVSNLNSSKSRLSPFLSDVERVNLLKVMLKDIVSKIQNQVRDIVLVSKDDDVYDYAVSLGVSFVKEGDYEDNSLNNALLDAIGNIKTNYSDCDILVLPSDIPLIKEEHILSVKNSESDMIISPSLGGGTNLLCFNSDYDFIPCFGDMSYFNHINEAYSMNINVNVIESFYVSLDVNTPQDLGEVFLHGVGTFTYDYLSGLNITIKSNHGKERLDVRRVDEE